MPTAADYFGFSRNKPLAAYFPQGYRPNSYDVAFAGHGPLNDIANEINDQATADLFSSELEGADSVPAIQKLISTGAMSPLQGRALMATQPRHYASKTSIVGQIPETVARPAQQIYSIRPEDEGAVDKFYTILEQNPALFQHQAGLSAVKDFQSRMTRAQKQPAARTLPTERPMLDAFTKANTKTTDEGKLKWLEKNRGISNPKEVTDQEWNDAWHGQMDKPIQDFLTRAQIHLSKGGKLPAEAQALYDKFTSAPQPNVPQNVPQGAPQAAPAPARTPNKAQILLLQQNPAMSLQFDEYFGPGAAATILGK